MLWLGYHHVPKVRLMNVNEQPAYYLNQEQHRRFFMSADMQKRYVDYWNDKLKMFEKDKGRWGVMVDFLV